MEIWKVDYKLRILDDGPTRSDGVHVSDVIRDLSLRGGMLDRRYASQVVCGCGGKFDEITIQAHECSGRADALVDKGMIAEKIELGIAWEERLVKHHPGICFHPGEVTADGIAMSIDGLSYMDGDVSVFHPKLGDESALHEMKLTWKSARRDVRDEFMWMCQIKAYLHGISIMEGKPCRLAFLHVFWVNGNYDKLGPGGEPRYEVHGIRFTDLEMKENWQMLTTHRDRMQKGTRLVNRRLTT